MKLSGRHQTRPHKYTCARCEIGMDDSVEEWNRNGGLCDACKYELKFGKMLLNAPVEWVRSTYNFTQSDTTWREFRK